jgi:serine/threonine protein kinase
MRSLNTDINIKEEFACLKQIGRGSFANVYLFENKSDTPVESIDFGSLIFPGTITRKVDTQFFIIKEIDVIKLSKKYISRKKKSDYNSSPTFYNPTPTIHVGLSEENYYHTKLKDLIEGEIHVLKMMSHPNIVKFFSVSLDYEIYSLKMEYCNLGDVFSVLKEKMSEKDIYMLKKYRNKFNGFNDVFIEKFLIDTVSGLKYIHDSGIIHRDIKLQNILLHIEGDEPSFYFKITDFGFACYNLMEQVDVGEVGRVDEVERERVSMGEILNKKYYKLCGTPYYMAPEMILNLENFDQMIASESSVGSVRVAKVYDNKIDIWGYGICLYELLFNVLPFSNLKDIHDLKDFYSHKKTQILIDRNIDDKTIINDEMKILLKKILTIKDKCRINTEQLFDIVSKIKKEENVKIDTWSFDMELKEKKRENEDEVEIIEDEWDKIDKMSIGPSFSGSIDFHFKKWLGLG